MTELAEQYLGDLLSPGERLVWSGRPQLGLLLRRTDVTLIPFSLLWGGFAIFWEYKALEMNAPWFLRLWGMIFVLVGLYLIVGRFFVDAWSRSHTYYALTDQRIIIAAGLLARRSKSLELDALGTVAFSERADRSGTITFGPAGWGVGSELNWPGTYRAGTMAFERIPNVRAVHDQIRAAQRANKVEKTA